MRNNGADDLIFASARWPIWPTPGGAGLIDFWSNPNSAVGAAVGGEGGGAEKIKVTKNKTKQKKSVHTPVTRELFCVELPIVTSAKTVLSYQYFSPTRGLEPGPGRTVAVFHRLKGLDW